MGNNTNNPEWIKSLLKITAIAKNMTECENYRLNDKQMDISCQVMLYVMVIFNPFLSLLPNTSESSFKIPYLLRDK